jgi:hypothetical protein
MIKAHSNILLESSLMLLSDFLNQADFQGYDLGGTTMWACELPQDLRDEIKEAVEDQIGQPLRCLQMFARYNDPEHDTSFRIHSDVHIEGELSDYSSILYLVNEHGGTAFYKHPEHGCWGDGVFLEDDGKWEETEVVAGLPNSLLTFPSELYHSRHPHSSISSRVVIIGFFKEVEND